MMSSVCRSLTKITPSLLQSHKNVSVSKHMCGISKSLQIQRKFTRSMWHLSKYQSQTEAQRIPGWPKTCGCCGLHTEGDKEISAFLTEEIALEKKSMKDGGELPKVKNYQVTNTDGANITLTRKTDAETVTVKLNVNHSIEDTGPEYADDEGKPEAPPAMVSRPPFVVEITKAGQDMTLALQCGFPLDDMAAPEEGEEQQYMDMIEIQEVTLLQRDQKWEDNMYSVSGHVMDGNLYDMLLNMLEERGVDGDFVDQMVALSTTYEHNQYVGFLEQLKGFMG